MFSKLFQSKPKKEQKPSAGKEITRSTNHEHVQVLGFKKEEKTGAKEPDIRRELYSVPKPENQETMADHIRNHKAGDIFPYLAITGKQEETKDSRLARLRSFTSPYGKSTKPEMRINGVVLDMLDGKIQIDDLKAHVDAQLLSREQNKQNRRFKPIAEQTFSKPYIHLARITGEFVPLLSNTADYTDLMFSLQDDRLLENQVVVQSNKIPTNSNGVFELSCDYCIPTKDIRQLSLCYNLARPIMKEGFQWGAVSLTIRISESDTPYLTPKVEAMAVIRAPYTAVDIQDTDPDHKDVTYTSGQIEAIRKMFLAGEVVDVDEPLKERLKQSSYSKSTIKKAVKGTSGPDHLGDQEGWEMMKGMKKPLISEDVASVSAPSGDDEDDIDVPVQTKEAWMRQQEMLRREAESLRSALAKTQTPDRAERATSLSSGGTEEVIREELEDDDLGGFVENLKRQKSRRKGVSFNVEDV